MHRYKNIFIGTYLITTQLIITLKIKNNHIQVPFILRTPKIDVHYFLDTVCHGRRNQDVRCRLPR